MATRRPGLAELMGLSGANAVGAGGGKLTLSQLPQILGDSMPDLPKNPVGRHRLVRALQQRFGSNFRSLPGVQDLVAEFDSHIAHEQRIAQMKQIKPRR